MSDGNSRSNRWMKRITKKNQQKKPRERERDILMRWSLVFEREQSRVAMLCVAIFDFILLIFWFFFLLSQFQFPSQIFQFRWYFFFVRFVCRFQLAELNFFTILLFVSVVRNFVRFRCKSMFKTLALEKEREREAEGVENFEWILFAN